MGSLEIRSAFRALRAAPATTAAAILVIAVGVGANTAVFAVTYGVLLRPLPYPDASRLVILSTATPDGADFGVGLAEVEEWRRRLRTVEGLAAFSTRKVRVLGAGEPRLVRAAEVTESFFDVLGVPPARGDPRPFAAAAPAAVVSGRLADTARQAAGLDLLGAPLRVGEASSTVATVLPTGFDFPSEEVDVWIPTTATTAGDEPSGTGPDIRNVRMVARLRPGVSLGQMNDDAVRVLRELRGPEAATPEWGQMLVTPVEDALVGGARAVLRASSAAAALVLLVTCGNVAMLLLGRAIRGRGDAAVRLALGAGAWRLARATLAEGFMLATAGTLLGVFFAALAVETFAGVAAGLVPRSSAVEIGPQVLAASAVTVLIVALLCAGAPAWHVARRDFASAFRAGTAGEARTPRMLGALVAAQIAAAIVLVTGAALLARTVFTLMAEDTGIESPAEVLAVQLPLDHAAAADAAARRRVASEVLDRVRGLPGVERAGMGSNLPPNVLPFQVYVRWRTETREVDLRMSVVSATPGFLEALGTRLVSGRTFRESDERSDRGIVLLSESAARFYAPGEDLTGRELPVRLPPVAPFDGPPRVAGLVRDVKYAGLDQPAAAAVYLPWSARPTGTAYLVVRTAGRPKALAPLLRRVLADVDPELPIPQIRTLEEEIVRSIAEHRLRVVPALGFAVGALLVALIGIFALFARVAAERRREVAIRMALGASRRAVATMVLKRAAVLTGAGLAAGVAATLAVASGLESLLFGVAPHDPVTIAAVVLFVAAVSLAAAWLPARRAARVEPWELLRSE